ncbi:MAG TPA: hypothetical protein VM487_08545 [Phycisphaerae bacterium]|nr:hypothetical protein [Phycisphaerae bacterium]
MNRFALTVGLVATLFIATGWAQDDDPNAPLAEKSPAQNVRATALHARAPSNWVNAARARHAELINARVNGPRFGNAVQDQQDQGAADSAGSTSGTSGLGDLITQLTGSGALGSLANLFAGASGLGGTSTGTGASGVLANIGTSTGSTTGGTTGSLAGIPADALAMIAAAGIDISDLSAKSRDDSASGAIARLPSKDVVSRAQSQDNSKFHVRLVDSLLSTFFTALSVGFQTSEFIDSLKGFLRPIFIPTTPTDTGTQGGGTPDGGGGSGTTGDGTGGGGGIEDLSPSESEPGDTGSIVRHVRPAPDGLNTARVA